MHCSTTHKFFGAYLKVPQAEHPRLARDQVQV